MVNFKQPRVLHQAFLNSLIDVGSYVFPIVSISVEGSNDGIKFSKITETKFPYELTQKDVMKDIKTFTVDFPNNTSYKHYRFTVLSEALDIADTSSTATSVFTPNTVNTSNIHLVASGIQTLQGQMTTLTSTNFITLLTYTFDKYRYESEQTLRILNKNEAQQSTTMNQLATKLTDTVYGDIYYSNLSTYAYTMYSTTQSGLSNIIFNVIFHYILLEFFDYS
jgi:hypothetical protein